MAASSDDCISASKQLIELLNTISNGNDKLSEKVCALFEHGAQKDYIDNTGQTYLHIYMRKLQRNFDSYNWSTIVDVLLNHGCDINAQDLNKATPLFLFLCWIPHSPFPGQEDREEIPGWICPTPQQASQVVKKLLSCGSDVNTQGYYNDTPIYRAVCCMNIEICETLLEAGADGNRNSLLGGNSLYALANSDDDLPDVPLEVYTQMVHLLTKKGNVDINMSCIDGSKIIHNATGCCSLNLIDLFVNYGADYKLLDGYGRSVLHYAATNSEPEVLSYFLTRNLDVNSKDVYSYTPLHIACLQGNVGAVSVLLEGGADITATANLGLLPIHLCCGLADVGYRDVEEDKDDELLVLKVLLKVGADVNAVDKHGNTVLHYNAFTDNPPGVLNFLLEAGADPSLRDSNGLTAMEVAIHQGQHEAATVLGYDIVKSLPASKHGDQLSTLDEIAYYTESVKREITKLKNQHATIELETLGEIGLHTTDARLESNLYVRNHIEKFFAEAVAVLGILDSRFEGKLICSGSMYENARIGRPNEFDYMVDLVYFGGIVDKCCPVQDEKGFTELYVKNGVALNLGEFISDHKIKSTSILAHFKTLMREAILTVYQRGHEHIYGGNLELCATTPFLDIHQKNSLFTEGIVWKCSTYKGMRIMVDVNPVIFLGNMWPDECKRNSNLLPDVASQGIYVIPKNLDREMYYQDQFVWRISFSHLETKIFQSIPKSALETYRLMKALRECPLTPLITTSADHERKDKSKCEVTEINRSFSDSDGELSSDDVTSVESFPANLDEYSGPELLKTFYLKQLFLIELEKLAIHTEWQHQFDTTKHWTVCRSVFCALMKVIEDRTLFTYFIPAQNVYSDEKSGSDIYSKAQKVACQHIIKVIDSVLDGCDSPE